MRRTLSACIATGSAGAAILCAAFFVAPRAQGSMRPRYGGDLRVEMHARVNSMDPREWHATDAEADSEERVLELVYDRLVQLDEAGRVVPGLAIAWQHDANFTHWQFLIRDGVKFQDGSPVNAEAVAESLQGAEGKQVTARAADNFVDFAFSEARPGLLRELLSGRGLIFKLMDDNPIGSGPFRVADFQPQRRITLAANEDCWSGRPFVDRVEIQFGVPPAQQALDLELGKADVVEVLPSQARTVARGGGRVTATSPVELIALQFTPGQPMASDPNLRQALSLAIDRASIVNVLLQREGDPAGSLLPEWLSGYAFTFSTAPDVARAKQLRATLAVTPHLTLVYDGADEVAGQIAERIAVNARDANILITTSASHAGETTARGDLRLVRERLQPPDAHEALELILSAIDAQRYAAGKIGLDTPEQRYTAEREAVEAGWLIPIAFVPELYGVSASVHDWSAPRWGGWQLSDVWLEEAQRNVAPGASNQR